MRSRSFCLAPLPRFAAQPVERDTFAFAAIARQHVEVFDRNIQLVVAGIGQLHAIVRAVADADRFEPVIAADAVLHVHDQIARGQRRQFGQECVGVLALALFAHQPVAKNVLFGDQFDRFAGKPVIERQHHRRDPPGRRHAQRILPGFGHDRLGLARIADQPRQPRARSCRIGGQHRFQPACGQRRQVFCGRFIDIAAGGAIGRKIAGAGKPEIERARGFGFGKDRQAMHRPGRQRAFEFIAIEIERCGIERAIVTGLGTCGIDAGVVIIGNVGQPRFRRFGRAGVEQHQIVIAQMVEQRDQAVFKQRQPVFHPGQPSPVADRLIQRIAGGIGTEQFAIAAAKSLDTGFIEQRFARRQQQMAVHGLHRSLRVGVKQAQRFQLVAKEIEPQAVVQAAGEQIEHPATRCIFAGIDHRIGARIAQPLQQRDQAVAADLHPGFEHPRGFADAKRGEHALQHGGDGGDQQLRFAARHLQPGKCRQPTRADRHCRRCAIERQAIPPRKFDNVEFGCEKRGSIDHGTHRRIIGGDEHRAAFAGARQIGKHQRLCPARERGQSERHGCRQDAGQIGHGGTRAGFSAECSRNRAGPSRPSSARCIAPAPLAYPAPRP